MWESEHAPLMEPQKQVSQLEGDEAEFKGSRKSRVHITITAETKGLLHGVDHNELANSRNNFYI